MRIGILQPGYLPWLGFFEQIYKTDVFVLYDDVQYDKDGWRNRNRIKTANGVLWLTVPVIARFNLHPLINEVLIDNKHNWRKKHLQSIRQNYSRAPFFDEYMPFFEEAYSRDWERLLELDRYFIEKIAGRLGLGTRKIVLSSSLGVRGDRLERLVAICKTLHADTFYEGAAGRNYIDENDFSREGIRVEYQDYRHPFYTQLYGDFVPYLSVIDLLFNHGPESLAILTGEKDRGIMDLSR